MSNMKTNTSQFNVIFRPEAEGCFTAIVPALPGCVSYGKDLSHAKEMITDAIKGYLVSLKKHRQGVPSDEGSFVTLMSFSQSGNKLHA